MTYDHMADIMRRIWCLWDTEEDMAVGLEANPVDVKRWRRRKEIPPAQYDNKLTLRALFMDVNLTQKRGGR